MRTSRDANDPRDLLRAMNKEARAEFEGTEVDDTGGQEHASRADREGQPGARRAAQEATERGPRSRRDRDDAGALRTSGDGVAAGEREAGAPAEPRSGPEDE